MKNNIMTLEDFTKIKQEGEDNRKNKMKEKESRKNKQKTEKNQKKRVLQELRLSELNEIEED